jgi:magnesium chelatase family protein
VSKYLTKVSGPLLDRLDLHIDAMPVEFEHLSSSEKAESSDQIKKRVNIARAIQNERFKHTKTTCNARIEPGMLLETCKVSDSAKALLQSAFERMGLSARAYDRVLKVSRTIADLDQSEVIQSSHIAEAVQYRSLDRKYWTRGRT